MHFPRPSTRSPHLPAVIKHVWTTGFAVALLVPAHFPGATAATGGTWAFLLLSPATTLLPSGQLLMPHDMLLKFVLNPRPNFCPHATSLQIQPGSNRGKLTVEQE